MADRRIKDIATTAAIPASDDYVALDGATQGTRRIFWTALRQDQSMGALYLTSSAATVIGDTTNFFKALGTTSLNSSESVVQGFDMPANNRLRYTGTETVHTQIAVSTSFTTASNNQFIELAVYFYDDSAGSGSILTHSTISRKVSTGADVGSTSLNADVVMDENDYLELHMKNTTGTVNVTLTHLYLYGLGVRFVA